MALEWLADTLSEWRRVTFELLVVLFLSLLIILAIFSVGAASPGPAILMILGTAISQGRSAALALSFGVVSLFSSLSVDTVCINPGSIAPS